MFERLIVTSKVGGLYVLHDVAENVPDCWTEQGENNDYDNSDQNKD